MRHNFFRRHKGAPFAEFSGHRGGGRGGRRLLQRGELKILVLKMLEGGARHGYDIIKDIEVRTSGAYAPSPGILYPTLALLEDMGAIAAETEGLRKHFSLTDEGRKLLADNAVAVDEILARLDGIGKTQATTESGPVRRATDNLHQVLMAKANGEPLGKDAQHDIADILDDAARRIERL